MNRSGVRKYPRVNASFPVECVVGDSTLRARASTLGGGGLFVQDPTPLEEGIEILVRFRPARHLPRIEVRSRVCYHLAGQGTGIEFVEIEPDDQRLLLRWILRRRTDRRVHPRFPLVTQVYGEECMWLAYSRDVSAGGMFIETKQPPAVGARLKLRFHLDDNAPIVEALGEVRYHVPNMGIGVQFVDMSPDDRKRLRAFVTKSIAAEEPASTAPAGN